MLVGAYYYPWYCPGVPWLAKTVRKNDPPVAGEYANVDLPSMVRQAHQMQDLASIDFAAVSWNQRQKILGTVVKAGEESGLKITGLYETLDGVALDAAGCISPKSFPGLAAAIGKCLPVTKSPAWLRIDDKPVIMVYVTRNLGKHAADAVKRIRDQFDEPIYLVGDELFWYPTHGTEEKPQLFDAVTAYNYYCRPEQYRTTERWQLAREAQLYTQMGHCNKYYTPVWPPAKPGYNDTGVRPERNHKVLSRNNGTYFRQQLRVARKIAEYSARHCSSNPVVMVTSWNEWFEDTQIEPAESYGTKYCDILKEELR